MIHLCFNRMMIVLTIFLLLPVSAYTLNVPTVSYPTLQSAYNSVVAGSFRVELSSQDIASANADTSVFVANLPTEVTLSGGFDSQFKNRSGSSVISGGMVITSGKIIADGVKLRSTSGVATHAVGITISSALSQGDSFSFLLDSTQAMNITQSNAPVNFPLVLTSGTYYVVTQISGPRSCTVTSSNSNGTVGSTDIMITVDCGTPSLPLPAITSFTATSSLIASGGTTQLTPVFSNGTGTITPGIGSVTSGVPVPVTPGSSTHYTLTVTDGNGHTAAQNLIVFVRKPFELVSLSNSAVPADFLSYLSRAMVTPDGRYVVFASADDTLVPGETRGFSDIYLRDRINGTTKRISSAPDGSQANNSSDKPKLSNDGCLVMFESHATNLVAGDPTRIYTDIYLKNLCTIPNTTTRVSVDSAGNTGNGSSQNADMSADGRYIVFASDARLTSEIPTNTSIYLRDTLNNTTSLVSKKANGTWGMGTNPVISADGSKVIYESWNDNLGLGSTVWQLYSYDIASNTTTLVSSDANGTLRSSNATESSSRAIHASISTDGRYVSFCTVTGNLVPGITNGIQNPFQNVFVKDTQNGAISLISHDVSGVSGNGDSVISQGGRAALSGNGKIISYNTKATNLIGGVNSTMVADTVSGQTEVVHSGSTFVGDTDPFLSQDIYGRYILIKAGENLDSRFPKKGIFLRDRHNAPVAIAGSGQSVALGGMVTLDGSGSSVAPNTFPQPQQPLSYTWAQTDGFSVTLSNPHAAKPTFIPPAVGSYGFKLIVNDTIEDSSPDTIVVNVH